nr:hypothetical protein [Saprospiraceae bacterium]
MHYSTQNIFFLTVLLIGIILQFGCHSSKPMNTVNMITQHPVNFNTDNIVIAHRGAWKTKNHPQNSLAALRESIDLG